MFILTILYVHSHYFRSLSTYCNRCVCFIRSISVHCVIHVLFVLFKFCSSTTKQIGQCRIFINEQTNICDKVELHFDSSIEKYLKRKPIWFQITVSVTWFRERHILELLNVLGTIEKKSSSRSSSGINMWMLF